MNLLKRHLFLFCCLIFCFIFSCNKNPTDQNPKDTPDVNLPDKIEHNGYVFEKQWIYHLNEKIYGWHVGNWSFDGNECEFTNNNLSFKDSKEDG